MIEKLEKALFPVLMAACLVGGVLYTGTQQTPSLDIQVTSIEAPLEELATYVVGDPAGLWKTPLVREGETAVVYLGSYSLENYFVSRRGGGNMVFLILGRAEGGGNAVVIRGVPSYTEAFAVIRGDAVTIRPLFRAPAAGKLLEVRGAARGADRVDVYAYEFMEDFNASAGPLSSLLVATAPVKDGEFRVRIDMEGGPYTSGGEPLVSVNRTLLLYAGCTYRFIYLGNITGMDVSVDLSCPP